jgi:hypothetical protein
MGGIQMRVALFAALILVSSPGHALTVSCSVQVVGFAALSITKDQGVRAIVSNVGAAPCPVQVSFFGADGSLIGNATTVQLKAGESTSASASQPPKLVRATVGISDAVDPARICELKASVEIFDVQTDMTFVSLPGESLSSNSECTGSIVPTPRSTRKNPARGRGRRG